MKTIVSLRCDSGLREPYESIIISSITKIITQATDPIAAAANASMATLCNISKVMRTPYEHR